MNGDVEEMENTLILIFFFIKLPFLTNNLICFKTGYNVILKCAIKICIFNFVHWQRDLLQLCSNNWI